MMVMAMPGSRKRSLVFDPAATENGYRMVDVTDDEPILCGVGVGPGF